MYMSDKMGNQIKKKNYFAPHKKETIRQVEKGGHISGPNLHFEKKKKGMRK